MCHVQGNSHRIDTVCDYIPSAQEPVAPGQHSGAPAFRGFE